MNELLIKKDFSKFEYNEISNDVNKISRNIPLLINTINDLINVINIRIELNPEEKQCIDDIKTNIDEILKENK